MREFTVAAAEFHLVGWSFQAHGSRDRVDFLPGHPDRVPAEDLRTGDPPPELSQPLPEKAIRVGTRADQQGGRQARVEIDLEVIDPSSTSASTHLVFGGSQAGRLLAMPTISSIRGSSAPASRMLDPMLPLAPVITTFTVTKYPGPVPGNAGSGNPGVRVLGQ